jgi:HlyD family secretion protein
MMRFSLLLLLVGLGLLGCSRPATNQSTTQPSTPPRKGVYALGRLEPASTVLKIAAPSGNEGNCIAELLVHEGDDVSQGQLLARMDTFLRRTAVVEEARARLEVAKARLAQIQAGSKQGTIEAAKASVESARHERDTRLREWTRIEQAKRTNSVSDTDVDDARFASDRAEQNLKMAIANLNAVEEIRQVDIDAQQAEIAVTASVLQTAIANRDAAEVRAPVAGRILKIYSRTGEQVSQQRLLEMGQVERMQGVAEVFEGDLLHVKLGQKATVELDSTGLKLAARVCEVGHIVARKVVLTNDPVSDTDARVVEVRLDLDEAHPDEVRRLSNARIRVHIELGSGQ